MRPFAASDAICQNRCLAERCRALMYRSRSHVSYSADGVSLSVLLVDKGDDNEDDPDAEDDADTEDDADDEDDEDDADDEDDEEASALKFKGAGGGLSSTQTNFVRVAPVLPGVNSRLLRWPTTRALSISTS